MISHKNAQTQFVEADGIRFAFRRFGSETGTPLVFLQHFRAGLDHWDPIITDGLAKDRPIILYNYAGLCSSGGEAENSVAGMARHLIAFLEALGLKQVDLLGFSLGGFVAQQVALDSPDLVRRAVLAGTGPQGGQDMEQLTPGVIHHATGATPGLKDYLYLFFAPTETSQAAGRAFWDRRHERTEQDPPSSMAAMQAQAVAMATWGAVPAVGRYESLKSIKQPVLVVNGHDDIMFPSINSYILQKELPNATLILYPDSGHGALFQFSEEFVEHVRLFLDDTH